MKKRFFLTITALLCFQTSFICAADKEPEIQEVFTKIATQPGAVVFTPPKDWRLADQSKLSSSILAMVIGKGSSDFPPSINLAIHYESGTLKEFLKFVKETNANEGREWKDLGTIRTQAGDASLSQFENRTEWGPMKAMQVILVKENTAYILTAAALRDEFSKFYKEFFNSMRSIRINKTVYEMIPDQRRRTLLKDATGELVNAWKKETVEQVGASSSDLWTQKFDSTHFQTSVWEPFKTRLQKEFSDMSAEWHNYILDDVKNTLE